MLQQHTIFYEAVRYPELVVIIFFISGTAIHGGPSPERGSGKHVWELHHPEEPVVSRVTGRDPGSGGEPGVEEREL